MALVVLATTPGCCVIGTGNSVQKNRCQSSAVTFNVLAKKSRFCFWKNFPE